MSFAMMLTLIVLAIFGQADPTTAPATDRVQFRLVAVADDPAAEVVRVAEPEGDETELRLSRDVVLDGSHVASARSDAAWSRARGSCQSSSRNRGQDVWRT
jgi:hypothetical protein